MLVLDKTCIEKDLSKSLDMRFWLKKKFIVTSHCNNVARKEITHKKNANHRLAHDLLLLNAIFYIKDLCISEGSACLGLGA